MEPGEPRRLPKSFQTYTGPSMTCPHCHQLHSQWGRRANTKGLIVSYFCRMCGEATAAADMPDSSVPAPVDSAAPEETTYAPLDVSVDPPPLKPTLDEYYERGRQAVDKEGTSKWEVGYNYLDMVHDWGNVSAADYAREVGLGERDVQARVQVARFYEPDKARKFQRDNPTVKYKHFQLAMKLSNEDFAYTFLEAAAAGVPEPWSVDMAEFQLLHDPKWGLLKPNEDEEPGEDDEPEDDDEVIAGLEKVHVCLASVYPSKGTLMFNGLDPDQGRILKAMLEEGDIDLQLTFKRKSL